MSESEEVVLTVKNANIEAMMKALEEGRDNQFNMVNLVTRLLVDHEGIARPFRAQYGFDLNFVFVKEGILANHAQSWNDDRQGVFALQLLRSAKQGGVDIEIYPA
ncbi:hypothetical protein [Aeromonas hydrophila]|uniref:hypothetical protein n=1 Tax=Aeromonas hydrophila TaxID=644 RepID=UPI002441852F|nr:hypothetical protein [Aeromonas hydrophila]